MPGKMPTTLNQFSYDVMKIRVGWDSTKNCAFLEKTNDLLLLLFYNSGYFECGSRSKCLLCLSSEHGPADPQVTFCS